MSQFYKKTGHGEPILVAYVPTGKKRKEKPDRTGHGKPIFSVYVSGHAEQEKMGKWVNQYHIALRKEGACPIYTT